MKSNNLIWFSELGVNDVAIVGGKNSSLGEMLQHLTKIGVRVPNGFATTAAAYRGFLKRNHLNQRIGEKLSDLDINDIVALEKAGAAIREMILAADLSPKFKQEVCQMALCPEYLFYLF